MTINPEHMQRCETIEIKNVTEDDGTVDESVNFSIHLEEPYNHDKRIKVEPDEGTVIIRDQDGKHFHAG